MWVKIDYFKLLFSTDIYTVTNHKIKFIVEQQNCH